MENLNEENNGDQSLKTKKHRRKHKLKHHRHKTQMADQRNEEVEKEEEEVNGDFRNLIENKIAELEINSSVKENDSFDMEDLRHENRMPTDDGQTILEEITGNYENLQDQFDQLSAVFLNEVSYIHLLEKKISSCSKKVNELKKSNEKADLAKSNTLQDKFQQLCRGLQRQNKIIISDGKRMAEEEQAKRQELSEKFHKTIEEVSVKLNEQGTECVSQLHENESLREKLSQLIQQFETREEQYNYQLKASDLKVQLAEAKLNHQVQLTAQEETKCGLLTAQVEELSKKKIDLQSQLQLYAEKFQVFQETLTKSNDVFVSFKTETDRMSGAIKQLEKENLALRKKCEKYDMGAIAAISEKTNRDREVEQQLAKYKNQVTQLQGTCRILQKERDEYRMSQQGTENPKS